MYIIDIIWGLLRWLSYSIDVIWEVCKWIWKNRHNSFTLVALAPLGWIIVDKAGRKLITNQLKRLFNAKNKSEFATYTANQARIESKVDLLIQERGLVWDADYSIGKTVPKQISGVQKRSLLQQVAYAHVTIAGYFTRSKVTYHLSQRRMRMKSKLLSRKFILALATGILVILNDGLDLGLKTETIMYVVGIVATWILGESAVDVSRKEKPNADFEVPIDSRP